MRRALRFAESRGAFAPSARARRRTSEFENVYIRAMMRRTNGNLTRAAELAGVNRRFLQRTIVRLGLRAELDDDGEG